MPRYCTLKLKVFFLLPLVLLTAYCLPLKATVRFVSKTGNSTPPYLTWETAADSIQKCINICVFGDTIYVANGVYEEQVVMIPGLSLIGAGSDSCEINTQSLVNNIGFVAVDVKDNCLFAGFTVTVYYNNDKGYGVNCQGNCLITLNKITQAGAGFGFFNTGLTKPTAYKNNVYDVQLGAFISDASPIVKHNNIFTSDNNAATIIAGVYINSTSNNYYPIIDSNYIMTVKEGIRQSIGSGPIIKNNTIVLVALSASGIFLSTSDSAKVYNNLIYAKERSANYGIRNNGTTYLQLYNNYISGYFDSFQHYVVTIGPYNTVKNNIITKALSGVEAVSTQGLVFQYNDVWKNGRNYSGFTPDTTNLSVDPMIVNDDTTQGDLDFHLQKYSPLIDAGDPTILDRDGSRSDIGLYGGPYGWTYTYEDLAPRPPHNLTATIEEGLVKLTWNKNTEADFSHYWIYRDTVTILIYDSTKMIAETPDTFYYDQLPPVNHETRFYYVITAFDNQGNQSYPSEEINVLVTGLGEHPPKGYDGYRLLANYPNPFNPSTVIPYRLKEGGYVKLYVYDLKGELVKVLVNQWQEKGFYEVVFHPTLEERGKVTSMEVPMGKRYNQMSSGIYLYMIQVYDERNIPVFSDAEKMILLK